MGKAFHKPRPSVPHWFFAANDNCWFCKFHHNQRGCTGCKILKREIAKERKKRIRQDKNKFDF